MNSPKTTRRELLTMGVPALAGTAISSGEPRATAAEATGAKPLSGAAWAKRRKEIVRAWLDLMGDFPTEIPPLKPVMKKAAYEKGITRYHVSFQAEPDDRDVAHERRPHDGRPDDSGRELHARGPDALIVTA